MAAWRLLHRPPALHRVDVVGVAGERDAARLADVLGAALVVGVDVGQRQHRDLAALELGEDAAPVPAPAGVDQHVLGQVDVDRGRRELLQPPDPGRQVLQCGRSPSSPRGSPLCSASSSSSAILRSPSIRAGWSAGSGSIRRRIRLRTWSAKWGVEAPARARMSSTLTSLRAAEQLGVLGLAHPFASDLASSASSFDFRLLIHVDRLLVTDHPDVVVEGAGRIGGVAGLDVEKVVCAAPPAAYRRCR